MRRMKGVLSVSSHALLRAPGAGWCVCSTDVVMSKRSERALGRPVVSATEALGGNRGP